MKSPPVQFTDDAAREMVEEFAERGHPARGCRRAQRASIQACTGSAGRGGGRTRPYAPRPERAFPTRHAHACPVGAAVARLPPAAVDPVGRTGRRRHHPGGAGRLDRLQPRSKEHGEGSARRGAVTVLPYSLIGPFAGVFIDRWSRRRIMVVAPLLKTRSCRSCCSTRSAWPVRCSSTPARCAVISVNRFFLAAAQAVVPRLVPARGPAGGELGGDRRRDAWRCSWACSRAA